MTLVWQNPSQRTIEKVPLHLYLNAFSHEQTTWMRSAPGGRFSTHHLRQRHRDPWGYIDLQSIHQQLTSPATAHAKNPEAPHSRKALRWRAIQPDDGNPFDRSLVEVTLAEAIAPLQWLTLRVDFAARLPIPIARTGGLNDYFLVAQWFPKLGAFENVGTRHAGRAGFAARQFHGMTEFYANFADYDLRLSLPGGWQVAATGRRVADGQANGRRRVRYRQRAAIDFAFVAGSALRVQRRDFRRSDGTGIDVHYVLPQGAGRDISRWQHALEGAIKLFERRIGRYPYRTLTAVLPPWHGKRTGGMEYPTLITGLPADPLWENRWLRSVRQAELVLVHEFGHQYFYGLLASNEQIDAFLDEGFNSYWQLRVMRKLYGRPSSAGWIFGRPISAGDAIALRLSRGGAQVREAVRKRPSSSFYPGSWVRQIYDRSAMTFLTAANLFGQDLLDRVFSAYFRSFAFGHPDPEDFLAIAKTEGGEPLARFLAEAFSRSDMPDYRVAALSSETWQPPLGRPHVRAGKGKRVHVNKASRARVRKDFATRLLHSVDRARGGVIAEIRDPGWFDAHNRRDGRTQRLRLRWQQVPKAAAAGGEIYHSHTRIEGSAWRELPVNLRFRFEDGATVLRRWSGRAAWRTYHFWHHARLARVEVDPDHVVRLDVNPQNNARSLHSETGFRRDWSAWLGAVAQWVGLALSACL